MTAIVGTVQNDTLEGTAGDDIVTGLAGIDTFSLAAQPSGAATFSIDSQGRWVVNSAAGQDTLSGIEQVQFSEGMVVLGENETRVNTTTADSQTSSTVAALADGGYVVTWTSYGQDGSSSGVYAQRYGAEGIAVGAETRINTTTANAQSSSTVAALADGGYVVTWSSYGQDGSSTGVYAQRYAADGSAVGAETRINTTTAAYQYLSTVAGLADGGYVVTWSSYGQDGSGTGVYAQRYAADGSAVGAETRINTTTANTQYSSTVAALADGGYVVTWSSYDQDGSGYGVYAQQFDANGMRAGHPTLTGGGEDNVLRASAAEALELNGGGGNDTLAGGSHGDVLSGGSGADTFEFAASGNGIDRITDFAAGDRIVVAGASFPNDPTAGDGTSVGLNEVQVSAANGITKVFIGTNATPGADVVIELNGTWTADQLWSMGGNQIEMAKPGLTVVGGGGNDSLAGGVGNDTLDGKDGRDTMAGGLRNDTYIVDNPNDTVIEAPGAGVDLVKSSVSYTLAANVENLTLTGTNAINGTGNALNNVIVGNDAINNITGGPGADTLTGGLGADRFVYQSSDESGATAWDVITDFTAGVDRIDLYKIDANVGAIGNQAFTFIGVAAFSANATGQLRFDSATHMLYGSTNADATPEIAIQLTGVVVLSAADIVL